MVVSGIDLSCLFEQVSGIIGHFSTGTLKRKIYEKTLKDNKI